MNVRRYELIVFDWDGTLMDSAAAIAEALQDSCGDLGYPVPSDKDARHIIGLGLRDALEYILPDVDVAEHPKIVDRYRYHFLKRDGGTTLFAGAADMVKDLYDTGSLLGVATGKSRRGLDRALGETGLKQYIHASRCADEGHCKPHPGMLEWILDELNVRRERALMIGDTSHDMEMARAAGVARVAMSHGAHPRAELLPFEPLACLDSCMELHGWLKENG
jgi:phosphoglycolate phosphatase